MERIKCFLLEPTGEKRTSEDGRIISPLYRRTDTGEIMILREAPVGAIWRATWMEEAEWLDERWVGIDGQTWVCKTPGGDWTIDSRASNCTMKEDMVHKCWCRHGVAPEFTVDKNGNTCAAGGGSILCGNYHGFLRNGYLEQC